MKREVLSGGVGDCCLPDKPFIALMQDLYLSWSAPAKPNGSILRKLPLVRRRTSSCSALPLLLAMDHLRGTTQGFHRYSNFFFGNFIVRQPAFCVCCYHCSQLMFLTLFLASSVSQGTAQEESMKSLALLYAPFLLVCYISQE